MTDFLPPWAVLAVVLLAAISLAMATAAVMIAVLRSAIAGPPRCVRRRAARAALQPPVTLTGALAGDPYAELSSRLVRAMEGGDDD